MTPEEAKLYRQLTGVTVRRPLADKTMNRIAAGLKRYVLDAAEPFIVSIANYGGSGAPARSSSEPLSTVTANPKGGHHAVVTPYVASINHGDSGGRRTYGPDEPMRTVTASCRGGEAVVTPFMVPRYGERAGQDPRTRPVDVPGATITPTDNGGSLVAPVLVGAGGAVGSGRPRRADLPGKSVMPNDRRAVVAAFIAKHYGGMVGSDAREPIGTVTSKGCQNQVVAAHLLQQRGSNRGNGGDPDQPAPTVTAGGNHVGCVASFLAPYYGSGSGETGRSLDDPTPTVTTKERLKLVTVELDGEPYVIVDIGMRMLSPRELYRAQGFGDEYVIDRGVGADGEAIQLTKTAQVRMCGNSVAPGVAEAIVRANANFCHSRSEVA